MMTDISLGAFRRWWWRRGHRRFYGSQAGRTDVYALNAGTRERFEALVKELTPIVDPQPNDTVLDLGGGNGRLSAVLFKGCRKVVVLDLCYPPDADGSLFVVVADMACPPFRKGSFTKIFTYSTFPHVGSEAAARKMLETWDALFDRDGMLFVGDIPDRRRLLSVIARGVRHITTLRGLKYYFAISMISYFSRARLRRHLSTMGYHVTVLDQSQDRRFHKERFDLVARKRAWTP